MLAAQTIREATVADLVRTHRAPFAGDRATSVASLAIRAAGIGTWRIDFVMQQFEVSNRFKELLGFEEGAAGWDSGWSELTSLIHPEDVARVVDELGSHLEGLWPFDVECRMATAQGEHRWFRIAGQAEWNPAHEVVHVIGTLECVDARRAAEERARQLRRELLDASRRAGMAEVASGVLHNVGNALTSAVTSISVAAELLQATPLAVLRRARDKATDPESLARLLRDDARSHAFCQLLDRAVTALVDHERQVTAELARISHTLEHISAIVSSQQTLARTGPRVVEPVSPTALIDEALAISRGVVNMTRIEIVRGCNPWVDIHVDRHRVVQILTNLIVNAVQAMAGQLRPCLEINCVERADRAHIAVLDNGVGMSEETLAQVFRHGFTTKTGGHGFGLHYAALLAQDCGGVLSAASDGEGHGARFSLELPLCPSRRSSATDPRSARPDRGSAAFDRRMATPTGSCGG